MTVHHRIQAPNQSRSAMTLVLAALAGAGIPAVFLPFVEGESPTRVLFTRSVQDAIWIAVPFFLAPLAVAALLRWIVHGRLSRAEQAVAWTAAVGAAASYLKFFAWDLAREIADGSSFVPSSPLGYAVVAMLALLPFAGFWLALRLQRHGTPSLAAIAAMEAAYAANVIGCVWMFAGFGLQAGAYCAMIAAAAFAVHIGAATVTKRRANATTVHA